METATLLSLLRERDVKLWIENDLLKCSAPVGALDPDMRGLLASRKGDILALLRQAEATSAEPSSIVPIKPDGSRPPLFALSGHGGDVYYLLSLARHLHPQQPVLSVQPPGLDGSEPLTTVEDLARYEVAQIRRKQPTGPYWLAGHCAGGTLAFEAARQLVADGQQVARLALIGSPFPTAFRPLSQAVFRMAGHVRAVSNGSLADRSSYIVGKLRNRGLSKAAIAAAAPSISPARERVEAATVEAIRRYTPKHYAGEIDLFITADRWHRPRRWGRVADSVREHLLEDYAINELLLGPKVGLLADKLQLRLATDPSRDAAPS